MSLSIVGRRQRDEPIVDAAIRLVGFVGEEAGYIDNVLGGSPVGPLFPADGQSTFDNAEFVEEFRIELSRPDGNMVLAQPSTVTVTIVDDDF